MKNLKELKERIELELNEAVGWIYSNKNDNAGKIAEELAGHIKPIINEKLDEAFELGKSQSKDKLTK